MIFEVTADEHASTFSLFNIDDPNNGSDRLISHECLQVTLCHSIEDSFIGDKYKGIQ